jgi:hypothetical protein
MRARTASTLAWGACAAALAIGCVGLALSITVRSTAAEDFAYFSVFLAMATVGALILSRQPGNVIGILFLFIVATVVSAFSSCSSPATYALATRADVWTLASLALQRLLWRSRSPERCIAERRRRPVAPCE